MKLQIGEIPNPFYSALDQPLSHIIGRRLGNGEDSYAGRILFQIYFQFLHRIDGNAGNLGADKRGIHVKGGSKPKTTPVKMEILDQSPSKIAYAQNNGGMRSCHAQDLRHFIAKTLYIVSISLLPKLPKTG